MKTSTVPAQVTTIEDRIVGNFTVAQLLILMAGFGLSTLIYLLITPRYHFNPMKTAAMLAAIAFTAPLCLRIQEKIVADWLVVLAKFWFRPHCYVFTKNDPATRLLPATERRQVPATETAMGQLNSKSTDIVSVPDKIRFDELLVSPSLAVRFVVAKKGGINVTLAPLKR